MSVYMGSEERKGRKMLQLKKLSEAIKKQQDKFAKGMSIRNLVDKGGDLLKTFVPGVGHAIDFAAEQIAKGVDVGDPSKIKQKETYLTGQGYADEFGEMIDESKGSLLQDILGQGLDFAGTKSGKDLISDKFGEGWLKNLFKKKPGGTSVETGGWSQVRDGGFIKKYYGGGNVDKGSGIPTISDYFSMQGKTLGGSNKKSLKDIIDMLGE